MSTRQRTPGELREHAEKLRAQAAEVEAEVRRHDAAERAREAEARAERAREFVASYKAAPYEKAVEEAQADLDHAIREDPLVQAVAALILAQSRQRMARIDLVDARGRLGENTSEFFAPAPEPLPNLADLLVTRAEQIASAALTAERTEEAS